MNSRPMSNIDKRPYHFDGRDIGTGRIREIADNPYGDEEKCWLAKRVIALQAELEASQSENERLAKTLIERNGEPVEGLVKRVAELEEIATDYGMKFQRAQDALKHQSLLHKSEMEAAEKRIAELERSETQLIEERDNAESALNDAYKAVMGQAPEWSNWFSFADAIDEIELACGLWRNQTDDVIQFRARIAELEAREKSLRTVGVMSKKAFQRLEGRESRFIALWPRPEIYLPRKRPEDGVIVYARVADNGKGE